MAVPTSIYLYVDHNAREQAQKYTQQVSRALSAFPPPPSRTPPSASFGLVFSRYHHAELHGEAARSAARWPLAGVGAGESEGLRRTGGRGFAVWGMLLGVGGVEGREDVTRGPYCTVLGGKCMQGPTV